MFGALHAANPGATVVSVLGVSLAGVWLALGYVLTGELAIPIGAHVSWNFFLGPIYGFPVSGNRVSPSLVRVQEIGPDVLTGGRSAPRPAWSGSRPCSSGASPSSATSRRATGGSRSPPR
ncbi:type II CAAX prenyl endopeptidase Rce1 family protein [Halomarina halobia]|uniref:CPBP family glutamic-type intramembrane protease n=1 Tax=Halomarina halobia TaxID=3033386 RepID=UPI00361B8A40